jgi:hypothetical protein
MRNIFLNFMEEYIYKEENYQIVGVLFEVHRNLKGFLK